MEVGLALVEHSQNLVGQRLTAFAALGKYLGECYAHTALGTVLADEIHLLIGIGRECVDGNNDRYAELLHVIQMRIQIADTVLQRIHVRLVEISLGYAAVVLERADGRNQYDAVRSQTGLAALDVHEFLCAEVSAEASLCDGNITQLECQLGCLHAVAAVCDIGERTAVHQTGRALERLNQVGLDGILHQRRHRALCMQVAGVDRLAGIAVCHQNITETLFQVVQISGQTQDSHNLGRYGDHEVVLARHTVHLAAQTDGDVAERTVVHVHYAGEHNTARINVQQIALLHVVVQHGAQQVVCCRDGVHIAGKVQVDVLHRHDLRVTAACCAALDAEYRAERRLAQCDNSVFALFAQCLTQTDRGRGLALAGRRRVDGGNEDQLAVFLVLHLGPHVCGQLCLVLAVQLQIVGIQTGSSGNLGDRAHLTALCDFNIG